MERIEIVENGLFLVFEIADDKCFNPARASLGCVCNQNA